MPVKYMKVEENKEGTPFIILDHGSGPYPVGPFTYEELRQIAQHIEGYLKMGPEYDLDQL